jgi:hypothetical protein
MYKRNLLIAVGNILIPIFLAILTYFLLVGSDQLDPSNINWIKGGDGTQHYLGWNAFRHDIWRSPLGLNPTYGADISSSIVFSDSIPLLAIFFKLLASVLPANFQYFGIWTLLCFILQAWFAWRLVGLMKISITTQVISTALFLVMPPMLMRINLHAALTAHFLVLASLYLNFTQNQSLKPLKWFALLFVAITTHFYLFIIVGALWTANLIDLLLRKKVSPQHTTFQVIVITTLISLVAWQVGYLADASNSTVINHYGGWSPNLLVFFNANEWSYFLKNIYRVFNEEDSNFLGLGIISLLLLAILKRKITSSVIKNKIKEYPALILALTALTILAFSYHISIGNFSFEIPMPTSIKYFLGGLRSSGRFLWPLYYSIVLFSIYVTVKTYPKYATLILGLALAIQLADTSAKWVPMRNLISQTAKGPSVFSKATADLKSPFWSEAGKAYNKIVSVPLRQLSVQYFDNGENWDWHRFASFADQYRIATNFVYLSRPDETKIMRANLDYEKALQTGLFDKNTLYILDNEKIIPALMHIDLGRDLLANIDGVNVLAPNWKICSDCYKVPEAMQFQKNFQVPELGKSFSFAKGGLGAPFLIGIGQSERLGRGWSYPEAWGTWSDGAESRLVIPLPKERPSKLILDVSPFIAPQIRLQAIQVWINGEYVQGATLQQNRQQITLDLKPSELQRGYLAIRLIFFNQASPKALGLGEDHRVLALGLISGVFQ